MLPDVPGRESSREASGSGTSQDEVFHYTVSILDSKGYTQTKTGVTGETLSFRGIPVGQATITMLVRNGAMYLCYTGEVTIDVHTGSNQATIEMQHVTVTLKDVAGETLKSVNVRKLALSDLLVDEGAAPEGKPLCWVDGNGKACRIVNDASFDSFMKNISGSIVLTERYGISISELVDYITGSGAFAMEGCHADNDELIVVLNDSKVTTIPTFNTYSRNITVSGIKLDFSECTSCKKMGTYAFINTNNKWISELKWPASMTTIGAVSGVKDKVTMPLPSGTNSFVISNAGNIADNIASSSSTYSFYFEGTLADFTGRYTNKSGYSYTSFTEYGCPLYVMNPEATSEADRWINTSESGLDFGSQYMADSISGEKADLTVIPKMLFRKAQVPSIRIPDTVTAILDSAFAWSTASSVFIGSGIQKIERGGLFYAKNDTNPVRNVYYNGTIDDWMKTGCNATTSDERASGGPFAGLNDVLFVRRATGGDYVRAYDDNGLLAVNITYSAVTKGNSTTSFYEEINGQLQGLQKLSALTVHGTSDEGKPFKMASYGLAWCSDLETVTVYPAMSFGAKAFYSSKLKELWLYSDELCTCEEMKSTSSGTFSGITKEEGDGPVTVHVPEELLEAYGADSAWKSQVDNGLITLQAIIQ